jgi:membrane fusion protein (multidrug efflux system)
VALGLLLAALGAVGVSYARSAGKEETDDAQVEGHVYSVASRVAGQVAAVRVKDNQLVQEGEVLVELDRADLEARLEAARADVNAAKAQLASAEAQLTFTERNIAATMRQARGGLSQAASGVATSQASIEQARADVAAAESRQKLAQAEFERSKNLFEGGAVSQAELDVRRSTLDQASATLDQSKARLTSARAAMQAGFGGVELAQGRVAAAETGPQQFDTAKAAVGVAAARVKQFEAAQRLAELNLAYATIKAPAKGVISRRSVEVGQMVSPDRALLAIVPLDDVWVVANFKEDQIGAMKPGQPAEVSIDAFGKKHLVGHVESLAGGTGARFALLPPDNASGNFVKVVQRVPVLVRLDGGQGLELRPGLSAAVTVSIR